MARLSDTFAEDRRRKYYNGEAVEAFPMPNATTDGDAIVHFRKADVIVTGDFRPRPRVGTERRRHTCVACRERRSLFLYRGRVKADADHRLCFRCFRALLDTMRARGIAGREIQTLVRENILDDGLPTPPVEMRPARAALHARVPLGFGSRE